MADEKKPPQGVVGSKLFSGVDVMADRLEVGIYAFEPLQKRVAVLTLWVDPAQDEAWRLLHTLLCAYPALQAAGIDSGGHYTAQVYRFAYASGLPGSGAAHRVFATKTHARRGCGRGIRSVLVDVSGLDEQIKLLLVDAKDDPVNPAGLVCARAVYEWESSVGNSVAAILLV